MDLGRLQHDPPTELYGQVGVTSSEDSFREQGVRIKSAEAFDCKRSIPKGLKLHASIDTHAPADYQFFVQTPTLSTSTQSPVRSYIRSVSHPLLKHPEATRRRNTTEKYVSRQAHNSIAKPTDLMPICPQAKSQSIAFHPSTNKYESDHIKFKRKVCRLEKLLKEKYDKLYPRQGGPPVYQDEAQFPRDISEWLEYQKLTVDWIADLNKKNLARLEEKLESRKHYGRLPALYFGKLFKDGNRGVVLAQPTAFCPNYFVEERASCEKWPSLHEMRFEGDDRIKTDKSGAGYHYGRKLPLMRHSTNESVAWRFRKPIQPLQFDNPRHIDPFADNRHLSEKPVNCEGDFAEGLCTIHQFLNEDVIGQLGTLN